MMDYSRVSVIAHVMCLLLVGCTMPKLEQFTKKESEQYTATVRTDQCQVRAKSRFALFDRPDTYPISDEEKKNAYQALYNQCMKEFDVQVASPKPNFDVAASSDADIANLSPAAGGVAKTPEKSGAVTYSNGLMIIDTAKLGKTGTAASGSNVIVVQAPPSTTIAYPPAPTGPAAIAVQGKEITPSAGTTASAPAPTEPKKLIAAEAKKQPEKPKKSAKASPKEDVPITQEKRTVIFEPSRFKKNAEPVAVDLSAKTGDLNALQPAAGSLLDNAVTTNRPPAKD